MEWNEKPQCRRLVLGFVGKSRIFIGIYSRVSSSVVQPHPHITISLYAKRTTRQDALIGRQEIACHIAVRLFISHSYASG